MNGQRFILTVSGDKVILCPQGWDPASLGAIAGVSVFSAEFMCNAVVCQHIEIIAHHTSDKDGRTGFVAQIVN